jgi:TolB-like protein/tetratricopeptide (TPR) repeat protein/class 3 adenylate cyclase
MADEQKAKLRLEIAHVLFMDIVGYSKLLTDEQSEALQELNQIVRSTEAAREAEAAGELTVLPTGDGMALVFTGSVEEPVECALEISRALRAQPSLPVRMGIHSGPIHHVKDANGRDNIAGVGINIAQRVMDCGDAGHILVSKRVADDLAQQRRWQPYLHELGDVEVKHGVVVSLVNLYAETIGNPTPPTRLGKPRGSISGSRVGTRKALSPLARAIFIIAVLALVLAIMSVIFAPAIMRTLDQRRSATLPQPTATALPSLADTIKSAVAKQITDELQGELSRKKNAAVEPSSTGSAIPEKSIAVLPFDNLSRDPDNAYFAEGVQDEILTRLAKVADLKVISRTSTQRFKSAPSDLREIAKQLGVMHIVEGSVQKANDQVRVNVQLINALTDAHLWADTYDRKLTDIFAVESEIAKTIADTLQAKLTGSEKQMMAAQPTSNTEAYELYHKGKSLWEKRSGDNIPKAIAYYEQAIAQDPNYALAYAGLAKAYVLLPFYTGADRLDAGSKAKNAALKALSLDRNLAEAHAALGKVLFFREIDLAGAMREYKRAIELNPNDATAHHWFGNDILAALGRFEEAIAEGKRAIELDPLSTVINVDLGETLYYAHRYDEAERQMRKTLEMDPTSFYAHYNLGIVLQLKGDLSGAIPEYEKAKQLGDNPLVSTLCAQAKAQAGDKDAAPRMLSDLDKISQHREVVGYLRALLYLSLNNKDEALRWLEQGFEERDGSNICWIKVDPLLNPLRGDPRFEALVQKVVGDKK